ncbi:tetratricopeptide repeat protein [Candidatus Nitrosocosmicus arcticus]|uniref:Uncharacterized protein n=1 Tax=Candidatus Nitrosocosmicus arcticus TaxID=2035267 RepID=A0A557SW11_9ARCH|nr:tetratricopeptide repeat protein [Candidatus Nitrosocosmicus arcticus]TVP40790.1 hypothetical protein NARC_60177 [Candidatus Nitrosocosmicus arcticus]
MPNEIEIENKFEELFQIGNSLRIEGKLEQSLEKYEEAATIPISDEKKIITLLNNLGSTFAELHRYEDARIVFELASDLSQKNSFTEGQASAFANLGFAYQVQGEKEKALEYYNKALAISDEVENKSIRASIIISLGNHYVYLGQYEMAERLFRKSIDVLEETQDKFALIRVYNNLSQIMLIKKKDIEAEDYLKKSIKLSLEIEDNLALQQLYKNLAFLYMVTDRLPEAEDYSNKSLDATLEIGNVREEASVRFIMAQIAYKKRKYQESISTLLETMELQHRIGDKHGSIDTLVLLSRVLIDIGLVDESRQYLLKALEISSLAENSYHKDEIVRLLSIIDKKNLK